MMALCFELWRAELAACPQVFAEIHWRYRRCICDILLFPHIGFSQMDIKPLDVVKIPQTSIFAGH